MAKKVFFSFHYVPDNWRVSQVRQMGVIEDNPAVTDNDWESVTRGGDEAIKRWIDGQLKNRTCTIVLIGSQTANRKWINYEIVESWKNGIGVVGIHIHNLKNRDQQTASKGPNPFFSTGNLAGFVKTYDPSGADSKDVYRTISDNIDTWITEAIAIRKRYP